MTPWTRPFHNLRASCETELADRFPAHVVSKWLGNSQQVAAAHYLQVTEDHFARAAQGVSSALQKAVQQPEELTCGDSQRDRKNAIFPEEILAVRNRAARCEEEKYSREDSNL